MMVVGSLLLSNHLPNYEDRQQLLIAPAKDNSINLMKYSFG